MSNTNDHISYAFIEYNAAFHMKYKRLFIDSIYDSECINKYPLIITWAETEMQLEEESSNCLVIATKTAYYPDSYKISEDVFEDMLQAFIIFPGKDEDTSEARLAFVKALLNK